MSRFPVGASVLAVLASAMCACSTPDTSEPRQFSVLVRSTQFAPPPEPITDLVPTAGQLTVLFDASTDYSIREEDRAKLLDGPSDRNLEVARAWGAQPDPQHIEFTTVQSVGTDSVHAAGQGYFGGVGPYPVGPIPFVRAGGEWKVSRTYVCGMLSLFDAQQACL